MLVLRSSCPEIAIYATRFVLLLVFPAAAAASSSRDPNNSALLYYQACLLCPPDIPRTLSDVHRGGDPNDQVREQLNRPPLPEIFELIQAATRLSWCDWGILYSRGVRVPLPMLFSLKRIQILLGIQAKTLAANGQYRSAFENCMSMRRFAAHIGDDTFEMWAGSESMDAAATSAMQYVLGVMRPDEAMLTWVKNQLLSVPGAPWRPEEALNRFRDMDVQKWRTHPSEHKAWKEEILGQVEDEAVREEMQKLTASQLYDRGLQSWDTSIRRTVEILRTDLPYNQTCVELAQVSDRVREEAKNGNPLAYLMDGVEHLGSYYRFHINATAPFNALMNAIEIYLIKGRTGHLPEELPPNLPEDPYSGRSFEYQTTPEGFLLRCRAKSVDFASVRQFEFRVRED